MEGKMHGKALRRAFSIVALVVVASIFTVGRAQAGGPVTITKHADLGFTTSIPVSEDTGVTSPPCLLSAGVCLFHGAVAFTGTLTAHVKLATDVAMTYNPSDLNTPNGPLPVDLKYTPTPNGSTVTYSLNGTMTFNFDGCPSCPDAVPFSASSAPNSFTAPMGSDAPVTIPGSSSGITLNVGSLDVITASLGSALTLAPAPQGSLPGLGGAAAEVQVDGASGSPVLPIEWDNAGSDQSFTLTTPSNPTPLGVKLSPLLHWVSTSGNAQINLHWTDDFQNTVGVIADIVTAGVCLIVDCSIPDPSPVNVFSGGLGPVFSSAGLDTEIGNDVGGVAGPLVAARVAAGFVPVPLTDPPDSSIPPLSVGTLGFDVPSASISGAPGGDVLQGDSVNLTAVPDGGTGPFTYAWTKNGAPFATTPSITDTPGLGDSTYAVTVTDSQGAVSNTAQTTVHVYDFAVAGTPTSQQILTTGSNTFNTTESLVPGSVTSGLPTIGLSLSGLPSGATPGFSPVSGTAGGFSSTLTVTTANAPPGTYPLTLTGTDARPLIGGSRSTGLSLTILTPAQAIPNIITTIGGLEAAGVLNHGQANSLVVKLNHAIDSLNSKPNQPTACNQLQAFVNEVNARHLTAAQTNSLLGGPLGVLAIMAAIPC
jgi:hypothetical protein